MKSQSGVGLYTEEGLRLKKLSSAAVTALSVLNFEYQPWFQIGLSEVSESLV
jgi:hypothetical protein